MSSATIQSTPNPSPLLPSTMFRSLSTRGLLLAFAIGYSYAELTPCSVVQFAAPAYALSGFSQLRAVDYRGTLETSTRFSIIDTVNGYTTLCQEYGRGHKGQMGGDARTCFLDENDQTSGGRERIEFLYEPESGQLTFERSWVCNQEDGTFRYVRNATYFSLSPVGSKELTHSPLLAVPSGLLLRPPKRIQRRNACPSLEATPTFCTVTRDLRTAPYRRIRSRPFKLGSNGHSRNQM